MNNTTFEHKGVTISFDSHGKFVAKVGGVDVRKPSLDAMKKHIDNAAKVAFKPFTALADTTHGDTPIKGLTDYTRVEVIGVIKSTQRYHSGSAFVVKRHSKQGDHTSEINHTLYEDTPANIALLRAEKKKKDEERSIVEKYEHEINTIRKQQKKLNPNDFTKSKP